MTVRILDELGKGVEALRSEKFSFSNGPNVDIVHKAVFGPKSVDVEIIEIVVTSSLIPADDAIDLLDLFKGLAADNDLFVDNMDISASSADDVATATGSQPDAPRRLIVTLTDDASDTLEITLLVTGLDAEGNVITEEITVDYDVSATTTGVKFFRSITSIVITAIANGAASDKLDVGTVDEPVISQIDTNADLTAGVPLDATLTANNTRIPAGVPVRLTCGFGGDDSGGAADVNVEIRYEIPVADSRAVIRTYGAY